MVEVLGITLDYVTRCNMSVVWKIANEHNWLKYQAIYIGPDREADKMTVYAKLKACCLDG